jgi:2-oxo-4-hydroxy-4-carboxy-5-ureidoimidazoline decarboxylase
MSPSTRLSLSDLNQMDAREFEEALRGVVEHSPWVVRSAWSEGPFYSLGELANALHTVISKADLLQQLQLLRAHPELAGREALAGTMTSESTGEQARLGLQSLAPTDYERLSKMNHDYRVRFGFPLIIALRAHHNLESVFDAARRRLGHDADLERQLAIDQVAIVIEGRLEKLLTP